MSGHGWSAGDLIGNRVDRVRRRRQRHGARPEVAGDVMRAHFPSAPPDMRLRDVLELMEDTDLDVLPVSEPDHRLLGVVLKHDVEDRLVDSGWGNTLETAADALRHDVPSLSHAAPIPAAAAEMRADGVLDLPVVTPDGHIEGLLVLRDIEGRPALRTRARALVERWGEPAARLGAVSIGCALVSVAMLAWGYGAPTWVVGVTAFCALLAVLTAGMLVEPTMVGVGVGAILTFSLLALFGFGVSRSSLPWLPWVHLALAIGTAGAVALGAVLAPPEPVPERDEESVYWDA
jgi:CBS domain-containing protein